MNDTRERERHRGGEWSSRDIAEGVETASQPEWCNKPGRSLDAEKSRGEDDGEQGERKRSLGNGEDEGRDERNERNERDDRNEGKGSYHRDWGQNCPQDTR